MKNNKLFSLTIMTSMFMIFASQPAMAGMSGYGQYGQYSGNNTGATTSKIIIIDKKVSYGNITKGNNNKYFDNLSTNDVRFTPGQKVYFQIKVKNASNTKLTNVIVKDIVPAYIEPIEGPGTYNSNSRTITYNIKELNAGQEDTKYFLMQVVAQENLPADKGLMCITNHAEASAGSIKDTDTSQFCIEKVVMNVQQAPAAGPEFGLAIVALQAAGLGAGIYLRKRK